MVRSGQSTHDDPLLCRRFCAGYRPPGCESRREQRSSAQENAAGDPRLHPRMNPTRTLVALALCLAVPAACQRKPVIETEPVALTPLSFQYPEELWDAGVEGRTVLRILITEQGTVDSARVETPSGYAAFDSAALAGTSGLRFEPARRDGTPVRKWVLLPVEFDIAPADSARPTAATDDAVTPGSSGSSSAPPEKTTTPAASAKPSAAQETPTQ